MNATDVTYPLIMLVLGFIGRDIVPWVGARLVDVAKWAAPRFDRVLDALLAAKPKAETASAANQESAVTKG